MESKRAETVWYFKTEFPIRYVDLNADKSLIALLTVNGIIYFISTKNGSFSKGRILHLIPERFLFNPSLPNLSFVEASEYTTAMLVDTDGNILFSRNVSERGLFDILRLRSPAREAPLYSCWSHDGSVIGYAKKSSDDTYTVVVTRAAPDSFKEIWRKGFEKNERVSRISWSPVEKIMLVATSRIEESMYEQGEKLCYVNLYAFEWRGGWRKLSMRWKKSLTNTLPGVIGYIDNIRWSGSGNLISFSISYVGVPGTSHPERAERQSPEVWFIDKNGNVHFVYSSVLFAEPEHRKPVFDWLSDNMTIISQKGMREYIGVDLQAKIPRRKLLSDDILPGRVILDVYWLGSLGLFLGMGKSNEDALLRIDENLSPLEVIELPTPITRLVGFDEEKRVIYGLLTTGKPSYIAAFKI